MAAKNADDMTNRELYSLLRKDILSEVAVMFKVNNAFLIDEITKMFAHMADIMATKDDIANMATKDDIANMATKDDISRLENRIVERDYKIEHMRRGLSQAAEPV